MKKIIILLTLVSLLTNGFADEQSSQGIKDRIALIKQEKAKKQLKLYKDYYAGMPTSELLKIPDVYECKDGGGDFALCLDNQKFLGADAGIIFLITQNKLVGVDLYFQSSDELMMQTIVTLMKKSMLVYLETDNKSLDLVPDIKNLRKNKNAQAEFGKKISEFEVSASSAVNYVFVDGGRAVKKLLKTVGSYAEFMQKADTNLRLIQYKNTEDEEGNTIGNITFSNPKLIFQLMDKATKKLDTDF